MIYLQKENYQMALDLLKKSEILCENYDQGKAITYNNFACYYRRIGKLRTALNYLERALKIENRLPNVDTPADTHLNLCAVLSQLERHDLAMEHAMRAIMLLQEELLNQLLDGGSSEEAKNQEGSGNSGENKDKKTKEDRAAVLAIAYHNMGVELEFLKRYDEALNSYGKAAHFAEKNLGPTHGITENLRNVEDTARNQLHAMHQRAAQRKQKKLKNNAHMAPTMHTLEDMGFKPPTKKARGKKKAKGHQSHREGIERGGTGEGEKYSDMMTPRNETEEDEFDGNHEDHKELKKEIEEGA
mmetsp:Transcript_38615/g.43864  ORF Transcript_38615/g.43864 Transcript_38615/m.43864 type:complete len:300 (-) Transcript_38615:1970-2869(-)